MMNRLIFIVLSLCVFTQIGCASNPLDGPLVTLNVTVFEDSGMPLEGAVVTGGFRSKDTGTPAAIGETDQLGKASIRGHVPFGSVRLIVNKEGYYTNTFKRIYTTDRNLSELAPRSRDVKTTLRQIMTPVPLIAKHVENVQIPVKGEWVGYDLELGDWVEPHGNGERVDLRFRYSNKFLGYRMNEPKLSEGIKVAKRLTENRGEEWTEEKQKHFFGKWSGDLEISFPGEKEGILAVTESNGYLAESELRMPHLAPEEGYAASISWNDVRNGQFMPKNGNGFFLRVRVRERNDQILEANYAKINLRPYGTAHDGLRFDPRGEVSFSYYFNPNVNDRNLEFDPKKNLLQNLDRDEQVKLP
ncbi:MAG: carboxypeptidase-like regulatory domain-containing protein [Verrucomicrobiota bacterium]